MPHPPHKPWLLGFSPDRTLIVRQSESGDVVVKLFESGGMAAAEHEADLALRLAGPNTASPNHVAIDNETGKPAITSQFLGGQDLESTVLQQGALSGSEVLGHARTLAQILQRIHSTQDARAIHGYVHGDIKPANLLKSESGVLILLDFEHSSAHAPGAQSSDRFSGGTSGYSPPEAYAGHPPTPAFDIFGFGCTLHFLLCGAAPYADDRAVIDDRRRRQVLDATDTELRRIVDNCLAVDAEARPSADDLLEQLDAAQTSAAERMLDEVLHAILAGKLDDAEQGLSAAMSGLPSSERREALEALLKRARKLLSRIEGPLDFAPQSQSLEIANQLTQLAPKLAAFRLRFPNHEGAQESRTAMLHARNRVLEQVATEIQSAKNNAQFDTAFALIDNTQAAVRATVALGRLQPIELGIPIPPGPMQRDPSRFLTLHHRDVEQAVQVHSTLLDKLEKAEATLNLSLASDIIREFSEVYGGASRVVAEIKDRLHRLDFYLDRIGRMAPLLRNITDQATIEELEIDLRPTASFFDACRERLTSDSDVFGSTTPEALRTLRRSLVDLLRDYPHLDATAKSALDALDSGLAVLTENAWLLVEQAEHKLATPPIPIRPLQALVNRLDDLRMRELLIDLPDRPRAMLLDELENIRVRLEQARSTRDSIARGARESMKRGHLTTAIYDMKRAVDQFGDDEQDEVEVRKSPSLAEQFEEARRRKQQVEDAQKRNHALAADYAELAADPTSNRQERLTALEEREELLLFLCQNSGAERTTNYRRDLNEAHMAFVRERAAEGEHLLASAETRSERLHVVEQTLSALRHHTPEVGMDHGAADVTLEHWQALFDEESRPATRQRNPGRARARWPLPTMAALLMVAIGFAIYPQIVSAGRLGLDTLAEKLEQELPSDPVEARPAELLIALQLYVAELQATELELPPGLVKATQQFVEAAESTAAGKTSLAAFGEQVLSFEAAIPRIRSPWSQRPNANLVIASLLQFGTCTHIYGFLGAGEKTPEARAQHDARTKSLSIRLPAGIVNR